jgi:hypothetical protein
MKTRKRMATGWAQLNPRGGRNVKIEKYKCFGEGWFYLNQYDIAILASLLGFRLVAKAK